MEEGRGVDKLSLSMHKDGPANRKPQNTIFPVTGPVSSFGLSFCCPEDGRKAVLINGIDFCAMFQKHFGGANLSLIA